MRIENVFRTIFKDINPIFEAIKEIPNIPLQNAQNRINKVQSQNPPGTDLDLCSLALTTKDLQKLIQKNPDFFSNLRSLDLSRNNLTTVPTEIEEFTNLIDLFLSGNPLDNKTLIFLSRVGSNNSNINIDHELMKCWKWEPECVDNVHLRNILQKVQYKINQVEFQDPPGTELYLYHCNLTAEMVPKLIQRNSKFFDTLTLLNLSDNNINTLTKKIGDLTSLLELYLTHNNFTTLPEEIRFLTNLTRLNLYHNPLDDDTHNFLHDMANRNPHIDIQTNMSAYESTEPWQCVFRDMPEYENNAAFTEIIESDNDLQEFISKARSFLLYIASISRK